MMPSLENHPFFTPWEDPQTGVVSYILSERVAPFQYAMYYFVPSLSADGRYLWFRGVFPPNQARFLAAADLSEQRVKLFQHMALNGNPVFTADGSGAWCPMGDAIYFQPFDGEPAELFRMPRDVLKGRKLLRLVTDLTISADGKYFVLDSEIGNRWLISLVDVETGEFTPLRWFFRCHHHAVFSPTDPEMILVGQGPWTDPITGDKGEMNIRMWVMDRSLTMYEPVQRDLWWAHNCYSCHEWWQPDGTIAWCDYEDGVYEVDLGSRQRELIWPRAMYHAQCDGQKRFYCGDQYPYQWNDRKPCSVWLMDRKTGKDVAIASSLPQPPVPMGRWREYHMDPHPHFSADGKYVIYTTTALGAINVALCPVDQAADRM